MSLPDSVPRRDRAAIPSGRLAETNEANGRQVKRREAVSVSRPFDDSVRNRPNSDSVDATPDKPTEMAKPAVESHAPDVTISEPPQVGPAIAQPAPATPAKQMLFQVVEIRRSPTFSIQGLETKQSLHYQVLSKLDLERNVAAGTTKIIQLVEDTRLVTADDSSRAIFSTALDSLKRQQYTYRLNDRGEVIEFTGHKETRTTIPLDLASSTGFQLTSVIDEDGWKELAELTFIAPPGEQQTGEPWKRQMTHDWGALGNWSGITTFVSQPTTEQLMQIAFTREMNYTAPGSDAGGLPFQIRNAAFELQQASGTIEFDMSKQRVRTATENFHVRGTVAVELAGVGVQIELAERQHIEIRLSERRPSL